MKRKKAIDFLTVTLFFGVLLSFTIYLGLGAMLDTEDEDVLGGNLVSVNQSFFEDSILGEFVKFCDYKIFKHIDDTEMIIGKDEWLFEAVDSSCGYERLLDYVGGCPLSEEELSRIESVMIQRAAAYQEKGINYLMVVIPDSITVCSDKVPSYLGRQSENTRLGCLARYLSAQAAYSFVNPTRMMIDQRGEIPMYNNTENSINAYGAYLIYDAAVSRYAFNTGIDVERLQLDEVEFYTRVTDGRSVAVKAGLGKAIKNRTVSLSDSMPQNYTVTTGEKGMITTFRTDVVSRGVQNVVVECSDEWVRTQLMPFFSNTFEGVYYKSELSKTAEDNTTLSPTLVVQIIHESELAALAKSD